MAFNQAPPRRATLPPPDEDLWSVPPEPADDWFNEPQPPTLHAEPAETWRREQDPPPSRQSPPPRAGGTYQAPPTFSQPPPFDDEGDSAMLDRSGRPVLQRPARPAQPPSAPQRLNQPFAQGRADGRTPPAPTAGWSTFRRMREESGTFATSLKIEDDVPVLVKFLTDEPLAVFKQHWLQRGQGQRSFVHLEGDLEDCPLCSELGDVPRLQVTFNVIELPKGGAEPPAVKAWTFGPMVADLLWELASDELTGPLSRPDLYYRVKRTKSGQKTNYAVRELDASYLPRMWGVQPLTPQEIDYFSQHAYAYEQVVSPPSVAAMREAVDDMMRVPRQAA